MIVSSSVAPLLSARSQAPLRVHEASQFVPSAVVVTLIVSAWAGRAANARLAIVASTATIHRQAIEPTLTRRLQCPQPPYVRDREPERHEEAPDARAHAEHEPRAQRLADGTHREVTEGEQCKRAHPVIRRD